MECRADIPEGACIAVVGANGAGENDATVVAIGRGVADFGFDWLERESTFGYLFQAGTRRCRDR